MKESPKQKAIREAYLDKWNHVKHFVDEDGWCPEEKVNSDILVIQTPISFIEGGLRAYGYWRPSVLDGISHNRGWTRTDEQLPEKEGMYLVVRRHEGVVDFQNMFHKSLQDPEMVIELYSHWQPIHKPQPPIY